jgi:hypothetical protein
MRGNQGVSWIRRFTAATAAGAAAVPTVPTRTALHPSVPAAHVLTVSTAWHRLTGRPTPMWWTGC